MGDLSQVSVRDESIAAGTASAITSLVVRWQHTTVEDAHAAKDAKYSLKRYKTGATTGEAVCTNTAVDEAAMGSTAFKSGSTTELQLSVGVCAGKTPLEKGRCGAGRGLVLRDNGSALAAEPRDAAGDAWAGTGWCSAMLDTSSLTHRDINPSQCGAVQVRAGLDSARQPVWQCEDRHIQLLLHWWVRFSASGH